MAKMKTRAVVKHVPPEAIELFAKLKEQRATVSSCYEATKRYPDYHRDRTRLHRLMFPPVYFRGKLCCNFWLEDPMFCDRKDPPPHVRGDNFKRRCWDRGWEARCKLEAALRFQGYKETPAPPPPPADVVDGDIVRRPSRAERVLDFIETLTIPSGVGQGEKFQLMEFEKQFVRDIYEPHTAPKVDHPNDD